MRLDGWQVPASLRWRDGGKRKVNEGKIKSSNNDDHDDDDGDGAFRDFKLYSHWH